MSEAELLASVVGVSDPVSTADAADAPGAGHGPVGAAATPGDFLVIGWRVDDRQPSDHHPQDKQQIVTHGVAPGPLPQSSGSSTWCSARAAQVCG